MEKFKPRAFYNEVKEEMQKVSWPSKDTTITTTIVVIVVAVFISVYLGVVDGGLGRLAQQIIG